jgi:hypothetical protein
VSSDDLLIWEVVNSAGAKENLLFGLAIGFALDTPAEDLLQFV